MENDIDYAESNANRQVYAKPNRCGYDSIS